LSFMIPYLYSINELYGDFYGMFDCLHLCFMQYSLSVMMYRSVRRYLV
jgi:hypothetical protein